MYKVIDNGNTFEIKHNNTIHYFCKKVDADMFCDYLNNGLKVIKKDEKSYLFNDGSRLTDVSLPNETPARYVLTTRNRRTIFSHRYMKKYLTIL